MTFILLTSCEDNNNSTPSNNGGGGSGGFTNDICSIWIDDTNGVDDFIKDSIYFPNTPGCITCKSEAKVRQNVDLDGDGISNDTEIKISSFLYSKKIDISFHDGIFQGVGNYELWDSTLTNSFNSSDFDIDITLSPSQTYSVYRIRQVQTFNLNTFNSGIGQRIKGSFVGSLQPMCCGFPIYTVPVQIYFDVPVTSN